ncbi:MAG: C45 family autoproteolytic acyltransferase/hydrolase, partial [Pseudomonadota bacterium]
MKYSFSQILKQALLATATFSMVVSANADYEIKGCVDSGKTIPSHTAANGRKAKLSACKLTQSRNKGSKFNPNQEVYAVISSGSPTEVAYDHGFLLGDKANEGAMGEAIETINDLLEDSPGATRRSLKNKAGNHIVNCITDRIFEAVNPEFSDVVDSYTKGMIDGAGGDGSRYNRAASGSEQVGFDLVNENLLKYHPKMMRTAAISIELGNIFDYIGYHLDQGIVLGKLGTYGELIRYCGGVLTQIGEYNDSPLKFGCTGFVATAGDTKDGHLIHARNLDADLTSSYNKAPTVFLFEEKAPAGKKYYKYVATATAGLIYPGGISGFNEMGISVSLHQMAATSVDIRNDKKDSELAPQLVQRMLREAGSLEEAIALAQRTQHLASWAVLVSDGKKNLSARIELAAGDNSKVAVWSARPSSQSIPQSNHFVDVDMQQYTFTPYLNKLMESLARYQTVEDALGASKGKIDEKWAMNMLASHVDSSLPAYESNRASSFSAVGKVPTKVYSVMSSIAVPSKNEIWITAGEVMPAPHSTYMKFKVDFDKMTLTKVDEDAASNSDAALRNSLMAYGDAFRDLKTENYKSAFNNIQKAISAIQGSGKKDRILGFKIAYNYIAARLATVIAVKEQKLAESDEYMAHAMAAWNWLTEADKVELTNPYQMAMTQMFAAGTYALAIEAKLQGHSTSGSSVDQLRIKMESILNGQKMGISSARDTMEEHKTSADYLTYFSSSFFVTNGLWSDVDDGHPETSENIGYVKAL